MSFLKYKAAIEEGDTVIICRGRERLIPVIVKRGGVTQVLGGAILHDKLIGVEFGSKVYTSNNKGWVIVLHPTPELWTLSLPHRTQILYSTDISMITMQLELRPGSTVCECGTGSGSLSHAIARTIAPDGHLFTFEFHEKRSQIAKDEFEAHGLSHIVTVKCSDVCQEGFGLEDRVDAVFLDLPNPWEAISSAKTAIKRTGGRICSFSPCIEQVQKTCEELNKLGFKDIGVMECLLRPFDVRPCVFNIPNMGSNVDHSTDKSKSTKLTQPIASSETIWTCAQRRTIPGHTGFLTFATLLHKDIVSGPSTVDQI
ncbi:PREDICTED: tRNA (adenine(58)-N(1))-methyltransferase catalytic subunit TRMT61A-like [Amphimedon queenslandica]|uniref:tRNA (adenine(58)-N(1))-methyltransferase catalytic subunit TRMT61A n=1 Tax=Amphimedon queenslandica TaxID=400682 RepID=A0A1X7U326_AMPQE|nr:PREDICTED: tRNA (adenine(58)-N(1))-methyltransferase catalytic subunit TRMT61A-like [Amphimedon queenslandica]|eukprot:XP_003389120.1 PREDICTED: tRNA (adenine(58)-N(1))-methyltransferase catalytic subunit TRMT61A-like [Amphimedon queenslandica]